MIIETLQNSDLETREKMMIVLYYLGMADRHQLAKLLDLSVHTIDQTIKRLNKKDKEEKHVVSYSAPFNKGAKMYQLGPAGWAWMMGWIDEDRKYYQRSDAQKRHYRGMTDILIRLLETMGREKAFDSMQYYNTYEATELFQYPWQVINWEAWQDPKLKREQSKGLPRPDLFLEINDAGYWLEYDTGNEGPNKIKNKIRQYYRSYNQLSLKSKSRKPIIWITTTRSRSESMRSWLNLVRLELEFRDMKNPPPEMYFFTEGEDTDFFLSPTLSGEIEAEKIKIENI